MNTLFKSREKEMSFILNDNKIIGMRMDGRAFHTFTKQFETPYDFDFMGSMDASASFVINNVIPQAFFAYVQSDEITVFFRGTETSPLPFGGRGEKILSVSAASATAGFMKDAPFQLEGVPVFDARFFYLDDSSEVEEYLHWRRLDARKNAVTMAASTLKTEKELRGMSTAERSKILKGTPLETLPEGFFNGRFVLKRVVEEEVSFFHKKERKMKRTVADRQRWFSEPASKDKTTEVVETFIT